MQFELSHKVTENTVKVTFTHYNGIHRDALNSMFSTFNKLGANQYDTASFLFPSFITSDVIQEIIHNTCFVCGGLMQDGQAIQNISKSVPQYNNVGGEYDLDVVITKTIEVRKCQSCGHSHT